MLYYYKAIDSSGNEKIGYIYANSLEEALEELAKQNIVPVELKEEKLSIFSKISENEVLLFLKNLALLLKLKVDTKHALEILEDSISNKKLLSAVKEIKYLLSSGEKLSNCFKKYTNIFGNDLPILVEIGEETGKLGEILEKYTQVIENNKKITSKIKSALAYPLFTLISAFLILYILMTYVVPQITKIFKNTKSDLPLPTKILLFISNLFKTHGDLILFSIFGIILAIFVYRKKNKYIFDKYILKLPLFGNLIYYGELQRFFSYLSLMLACKINFKKAISHALDLCKNEYIKIKLERVSKKVLEGKTFSQALKEENFEKIIYALALIGEETAMLDKTLNNLSNYYKAKLDEKIDYLLKFLEPAITLLLGLIVGFIVVSIMLPLLEMSSLIK